MRSSTPTYVILSSPSNLSIALQLDFGEVLDAPIMDFVLFLSTCATYMNFSFISLTSTLYLHVGEILNGLDMFSNMQVEITQCISLKENNSV